MEEMCQAAVELGLHEIGFAEHYDLQPVDECYNWFKFEGWYAEIERCRAQFNRKLTIRAGVEFSEPHCYPEGVCALLEKLPFDYVIGSLHYVGPELIYKPEYYRQRSTEQVFQDYFNELVLMTATGVFDILGHLDILALPAQEYCGPYDPCRYEHVIRSILRNCIQRGILLEINTQGLRKSAQGLRKPAQMLVPGAVILGWYVDMGGESICLGSDAHIASHLGMHLEVALQTAREAGLKTITCFDQRQKRLIPIEDHN